MAVAQGIATQFKRVKQTGGLGTSTTTGSKLLRRVTGEFNLDRDTYTSNEIVDHQQSTGATAGIGKVTGKLNGELSAGTYQIELECLLRKSFAATTAITGLGVTIAAGAGTTWTLTRTGSWLTDAVKLGDVVRLSVGTLNALNSGKNLLVIGLTATVATVVTLNGTSMFAEGPISGCTVTVVGKKLWVPTTGHNNDYLTYEKWFTDLSRSELFTDCKASQAQLTLPATGIATINFDVAGLGRTLGASEVLTSPTAATTSSVLTAVQGKAIVGGTVTNITGAQLTINGNIQPGEAEVGANAISDHQRGRVMVNGSFTAKFTSNTLQALFDQQTPTSLVLVVADTASATADFITFVMTNVKLFSDTATDGEKEIIRTYNFTAAIDGAGSDTASNTLKTIISIQDSQAA